MGGPAGWRAARWRRMGADDATLLAGDGLTVLNGQLTASIATWSLSLVRYYFLDYDNGSDANLGHIDAAAGTTFTAGQLVGVPLKTIERLLQILPRFGNGRVVVILAKPRAAGATYKKQDGATDDSFDLNGIGGYGSHNFTTADIGMVVRSSADLTNSPADRVQLGSMIAQAGPNGDSSWTAAASSTSVITVNAAQVLPAAESMNGWRVRFDPNTATVALRNICAFIAVSTAGAGGTITVGSNLPAVPAAGDTFFVERPGVRVAAFVSPPRQFIQAAGFGITGTTTRSLALAGEGSTYSFFETTGVTANSVISTTAQSPVGQTIVQNGYIDEGGTFRTPGSGLRAQGGCSFTAGAALFAGSSVAFMNAAASVSVTCLCINLGGAGSYFAKAPTLITLGAIGFGSNTACGIFGPTSVASQRPARCALGPLTVSGFWQILNCDISNSATMGIQSSPGTRQGGLFFIDGVTGTGNATVGIDGFALNQGASVWTINTATTTITGAQGNLKLGGLPGGCIGTYADLVLTSVLDAQGNLWRSINGTEIQNSSQAIVVTNKSGGALAVGQVVRTNGTTRQVTFAQADTGAKSSGVVGVMVTAPADNADGLMVTGTEAYMLYDAAPAAGALVYLSPTAAGKVTTTVPPVAATNQKLRIGHNVTVAGNAGLTTFRPELFPVVSNGAAP